MTSPQHIAIIGAGISGLSCASVLKAAGHSVTVFDKSRGPSGRMSTRRESDWQCDHGAQYFTARDPAFRAEVERWQQAGVAAPWTPRLVVLGDEGRHKTEPGLERFVGTPRMSAPGRWLADSLNLKTQTTIQNMRRESSAWTLHSAEQGALDAVFDAVLLALPAPQAASLLKEPAPTLARLAEGAKMRGCWALMLRFAADAGLPFDAAFVNAGPLRWMARDSSKPGREGLETWLLHASAEWSEEHLELGAEPVAALLIEEFVKLGGRPPQAWTAHRWRYADTAPALTMGSVWDPHAGLGLCGDWLNGGKVEGAWLSGRVLAQGVIASMA